MNNWQRLEGAVPVLGRMHTVLRSFEPSEAGRVAHFVNYLDPEHATDAVARGVACIRSWSRRYAALADAAEELERRLSESQRAVDTRGCQGSSFTATSGNNVLYRGEGIVLIHDFDHMRVRARIEDLGLTAYYMAMEPGISPDPSRHRQLIDAHDAGLDTRLSKAERLALPVALARQPLWSVGGWIVELDDERAAHAHAAGLKREIDFARQVMQRLPEWQDAMICSVHSEEW